MDYNTSNYSKTSPRIRYMCAYGHIHLTNMEAEICCDSFDRECEWNDPKDGFFLALPGKGGGL